MGYIILVVVLFGGYFVYDKFIKPERAYKKKNQKTQYVVANPHQNRQAYSEAPVNGNPNMLSVYVPYEKKVALANKASQNGESMDALINRLIDEELKR